jgi:hypothetical protein
MGCSTVFVVLFRLWAFRFWCWNISRVATWSVWRQAEDAAEADASLLEVLFLVEASVIYQEWLVDDGDFCGWGTVTCLSPGPRGAGCHQCAASARVSILYDLNIWLCMCIIYNNLYVYCNHVYIYYIYTQCLFVAYDASLRLLYPFVHIHVAPRQTPPAPCCLLLPQSSNMCL